MRAVVVRSPGKLEVADLPDPQPAAGEVLVRVRGAGLNRSDLAFVDGLYPQPTGTPPGVPGLEFSGEVIGLGPGMLAPRIGAYVFGLVAGGAHAQLVAVPAAHCVSVPESMDLTNAGAVPEAFVTAHDAMVTLARSVAHETVLVHAAGSGVGTAAIQLARALGCTVVGTSRDAAKLERCRALGLDHAVLVEGDFEPRVLADEIVEMSGPADVTLNLVGGSYVGVDIRAAAQEGRIVLVGSVAGTRTEVSLSAIMGKRLRIFGTTLAARNANAKAAAIAAFAHDVVPLFATGRAEPVVATAFPITEAAEAYERLASNAVFGKLVLEIG